MSAELAAALPEELREGAAIERIGRGMSGAGVYRVTRGDATYVLKVAGGDEALETWRQRVEIMRAAAAAGVAPRVLHVDEQQRATLTEHVVDRSFPGFIMNPATRAAAIQKLSETLRRLHALPVPAGVSESNPRDALVQYSTALAGFPLPPFVTQAVARVLEAPEPPRDRALGLSHNDVNPSNIAFDGERVLLLDWDTASANDPLFDLATIAMFLRFDDATCAQLVSLHDGSAAAELPPRFRYLKRLVAALCGCAIFGVARRTGHPGSTEGTFESSPSLADIHQRMRAGTMNMAAPDGQWQFGLALIKESA